MGAWRETAYPGGLEIALVRVQEQGDTYLMRVDAGALRQPSRSQKDPRSFCTIRFGGPGGAGGCEQRGEGGTPSITREAGRGRSGDLVGQVWKWRGGTALELLPWGQEPQHHASTWRKPRHQHWCELGTLSVCLSVHPQCTLPSAPIFTFICNTTNPFP